VSNYENEDPNVGLRLLLLPESIQFGQPHLERYQQISTGLLDPLTSCLVEALLLEQVENRQFVLSQPFPRRALLLVIEAFHKFDELAEGLLDRLPVLLLIVGRDDLLVFYLVVHAHRVARKHRGELLFDDVADVLDRSRLAHDLFGELVAEPLQVDLACGCWSGPTWNWRRGS
jgi:hypothetical protein